SLPAIARARDGVMSPLTAGALGVRASSRMINPSRLTNGCDIVLCMNGTGPRIAENRPRRLGDKDACLYLLRGVGTVANGLPTKRGTVAPAWSTWPRLA